MLVWKAGCLNERLSYSGFVIALRNSRFQIRRRMRYRIISLAIRNDFDYNSDRREEAPKSATVETIFDSDRDIGSWSQKLLSFTSTNSDHIVTYHWCPAYSSRFLE